MCKGSHTIFERVRFSTIHKIIALYNDSQKSMNAFLKMNRKTNKKAMHPSIKDITVKQPSLYTKLINKKIKYILITKSKLSFD